VKPWFQNSIAAKKEKKKEYKIKTVIIYSVDM
jgi:hypothetical protein